MQATIKATICYIQGRVYVLMPILALILLLTGCVAPDSLSAPRAQSIVVVGNGNTRVQANLVQLFLGIEVVDDTVMAANRKANEAMDRVLEALASQNIGGREIKPFAYNIYSERYYPDYEIDDPGTVPLFPDAEEAIRYRVIHQLHVLIHDLASVPTVVAAVVEAGGPSLYIYSTDFLYDDPASLEPAARELAISDARGKAAELAALLGVELGAVIGITELVQNTGVQWDTQAFTPIYPGQLQFYKQLQVTYSTLTSVAATATITQSDTVTGGVSIPKTN